MSTTTPTTTTPTGTPTGTLPLTAGAWPLDANHSAILFKVRHLGLSNVRGRFNRFDATLTVGDDLESTGVEASIEIDSVDTNQADRDTHLRSTDFFSADDNPVIGFRSTAVRAKGNDYEVDGDLSINGVTQAITFEVEFTGLEVYPNDGSTHAGFSATTDITRDDFGIDFNMPLGMDKFALGKKISIEIDLQFVAPQA